MRYINPHLHFHLHCVAALKSAQLKMIEATVWSLLYLVNKN